jgi:murein DD-endopeptidase MepM/ murein hydrolase activator NlpD
VEAGETLYRIARAQGTTPAGLAELNGIAVDARLAVGQVLIVPAAPAQQTRSSAVPEDTSGASAHPAGAAPGASPDATADGGGMPPELAAAFAAMGSHPGSGDGRRSPEPVRPSPETTRAPGPPSRVEATVLGSLQVTPSGRASPATPRTAARPGTLQWPLRGVLYARFGRKGKTPHDGIDLSAPAGTPVRTAGEGTVLFAGPQQGYGLLVIVEHARGLVTVYAHNRDLRVRTGQGLREGQVIATVGESGKTSGPHLHFEVRQDGEPVDPLPLLGPPPAR